jgi:hypothetical protein
MTSKRFFIYSLPRSGSSWLSVFFSQPGSYCYHEPLADGGWQYLFDRMAARPEPCVGAIDTCAYQAGSNIFAIEPSVQTFVLIRNKSNIGDSLRRRGWFFNFATENDKFETVTRGLPAIFYDRLFDVDYLEELWGKVVGTPFDRERALYLTEMNVQRMFTIVKQRALG